MFKAPFFQLLKAEEGLSLVQIIVLSGIVSVLALGITTMINNQRKQQSQLHDLSQQALFEQQLTKQMSNLEMYRRTLNITPTPGPT